MSEDSDLDDLLDEFADEILKEKPAAAAAPAAEVAEIAADTSDTPQPASKRDSSVKAEITSSVPELDDEFARQLQENMEAMFQGVDDMPMKPADLEKLLAELSSDLSGPAGLGAAAAASASGAAPARTAAPPGTVAPADLKQTISQTMDRLNEQKNIPAQGAGLGGDALDDDMLANLLKELQIGGDDSDPDAFIQQMIKELTDKEIMYEGMKDMKDKLDEWLKENADSETVSAQDMDRYLQQQKLFTKIVDKYESPDYKDNDEDTKQYFTTLLMEVQGLGSPPPNLVTDKQLANMLGINDSEPADGPDCNVQ